MSLLYPDSLPKSVIVDDIEYEIRWQYYVVLELLKLFSDRTMSDNEKAYFIFDLFYVGIVPENKEYALKAVTAFIDGGSWDNGYESEEKSDRPVMDWNIDAPFIWASMKQTYPFWDWSQAHWWEFKAAFDALPDTAKINEIIRIRLKSITGDMTSEQRKAWVALKKQYALPERPGEKYTDRSAQDIEADLKRQAIENGD